MVFKIRSVQDTRAKWLLRAWGEHVRVAWAVSNGLSATSIYDRTGDMGSFAHKDIDRMVVVMNRLRVSNEDHYNFCRLIYVDQKRVEDLPGKNEKQRAWHALTKVRSHVFQVMYCDEIADQVQRKKQEKYRRQNVAGLHRFIENA